MTSDWREPLLVGAAALDVPLGRRDPIRWPGYHPQPSVQAYAHPAYVLVTWDFHVQGGSFGEDDATVLQHACAHAIRARLPLLTVVRTGGTRLQEGMAALVGIPRALLALQDLAAAHLPHVSVADGPTTGGVWISVVSQADVRVAVEHAVIGFAGPRVVEAMTGSLPGPDSHHAESALAAGLVDAVLAKADIPAFVLRALATLTAPPPTDDVRRTADVHAAAERTQATGGGWEQVQRARARTTGGAALLKQLLTDAVALTAPHGDTTVAAYVGRLQGRPVVGVALGAEVGARPTPDGYGLATRAYRLADRLQLPVLSLVDTPGADPSPASERDGIAPAMGEALDALLRCGSPTVALVHGEGGSGGALAGAAADVVLVTEDSYFAPIGPEGAHAALRRPADECADLMRITPADLVQLGFADAVGTVDDLAGRVGRLAAVPAGERLETRRNRWSAPLPGTLL